MSRRFAALAGCAAAVLATSALAMTDHASAQPQAPSKHVLLLSIDGLHQSDLAWYVAHHRDSNLAALVAGGTEYTHARTTFPSDSFPGMVAQLTGGTPGATGIYYDDTYNRTLFAPGTTDCSTAQRGAEVSWTEAADRSHDPIVLDAGQGLAAPALTRLPANTRDQTLADSGALTTAILQMTPTPQTLLDPDSLPIDPTSCTPLYPHNYLRVNTVFQVVKAHGGVTAWSDKHPAYEILNGPGGNGIDDLFAPEINSVADNAGDDWTTDNALTEEYDGFKVAAVLNEIDGKDHSGARTVGTPAVFGMNFQTVSTAQKLPSSDGLAGGYLSDGAPGPLVQRSLDYVDTQIGRMRAELAARGLTGSTTIIVSAKHGQSPRDPAALRRVDDGPILDGINAGWVATHPNAAPLVAFAVDDDVMLLWLSNRGPAALGYVRQYLLTHPAPANTINDPKGVFSTSVTSSGLASVHTGPDAHALFGATPSDSHAPDVVGIVQHGVVYTGGVKKIAEHGGDTADDRAVALVVSGAGALSKATVRQDVATAQIAPTILHLLGLNPESLQAVRSQHTQVLPGVS